MHTKRQLAQQFIYIRDLLRELILRDLKIHYKRSYLGVAWSLVTPVAQVLIFSFLFKRVVPIGIPNYTTFVFVGVLSWAWFSASLNSAAGAVVQNPGLVRRPGFPVAVLPVLAVISSGIQFLLALPIFLLVTVVGGDMLGPVVIALPVVIGAQFFFTLSLAYCVAASNVRFRDTQYLVASLLTLTFYLTPVFYSTELVPEEYVLFYKINPMTAILQAYRDVLIENRWPDLDNLLWVSGLTTILLSGTFWLFRRMSIRFAEEL